MRTCVAFGVLLLSLSACAPHPIKVAEQPTLPHAFGLQNNNEESNPAIQNYKQAYTQIPVDWWTIFEDEQLNTLMSRALTENADMARAAIQLKKAQLNIETNQQRRAPKFSLGASASVRKSLPFNQQNLVSTDVSKSFGASFGVSYELDLFNKLSLAKDSAQWQAYASQEDARAVKLAQTTQVALNYWQTAYVNEQIALAKKDIEHAQNILRIVQTRFRAGVVPRMDVLSAKRNVLSTQLQITSLKERRQQLNSTLAILLNQPSVIALKNEQAYEEPKTLPNFNQAFISSLGLSQMTPEVLYNRPDIAAAEWRLRSTLQDARIARKAFYPSFNLSASVGTGSNELVNILKNPVASLALSPVLPFFNRKQNRLAYASSKLDYEAAVLSFKKQLYTALSEVNNALTAQTYLSEKHQKLVTDLDYAEQLIAMKKVRYLSGEDQLQNWLNAQQNHRQALRVILDNQFEQYRNFITLFVALGGSPKTKQQ